MVGDFFLLTDTCSAVHESRLTDFTFDRCTPKFLWIPAHRIHKKIPRFQEAHLGPDEKFITYYMCRMKIMQHLHVPACMWYSLISLLRNDIHILYNIQTSQYTRTKYLTQRWQRSPRVFMWPNNKVNSLQSFSPRHKNSGIHSPLCQSKIHVLYD